MTYRVLVEQDRSEPGRCAYSAYLPEIPNCFTCADSWEELEAMVREVVALAIESHAAGGHNYPQPTGFQFLVEVGV